MNVDELTALRALPAARLRRNYWLCVDQLKLCLEPRHEEAAKRLQLWQQSYLDEIVRRGIRV